MEKNLKGLLAKTGHKKTKAREAVFDMFAASNTPISARDIWKRLNQGHCSMNLSTVYRTIELFMEKGIIEKILLRDGTARYQLRSNKHRHHLICTSCNITVELEECPLGKACKNVEELTSFDLTGHTLELYGICPNCKCY